MSKKARILVSLGILSWLAWRTNWSQVSQAFSQLNLKLWLAAVGLYVLVQGVSALRWQLMAKPLGFQDSLRHFVAFYFIAMYFNLFLPTSVGGDVVRAWYLDRGAGRRLASLFTVFVDRASGLLILLVVACLGAMFYPFTLPGWISASVWAMAGAACFGLLTLPLLVRYAGRSHRVGRIVQSSRLYLAHPILLFASAGLSLLVQAGNIALVWLVGRALGVSIPASYYMIFVPMVSLLTLLPVSLNGMGIREYGTVMFLAPLGVPEGMALSLAFLWFCVYAVVSLSGGGVYLFGRFSRPEGQLDHEPIRDNPDQGRARQSQAAA